MVIEKGLAKKVWIIMTTLSVLFTGWTLFVITRGDQILPTAFKLAGSSQLMSEIESKAPGFMDMTMLKPLWEEIWIGIFGFFIAIGLKKKKKYAWTLGLFW